MQAGSPTKLYSIIIQNMKRIILSFIRKTAATLTREVKKLISRRAQAHAM